MGVRDLIAKAVAANLLHGAEARGAEALTRRIEPNIAYPPRTDLTTDAYHGTRRVYDRFMPWSYDEAGSIDRALGTHAAKDPAMSSEAFTGVGGVKPSEYNRLSAEAYDNIAEKPHVIPLKIPDESTFLQARQPLIYPRPDEDPIWRKVRTDTSAVEHMVAEEAFKREPEMLQEYLQRMRAIHPDEARPMSRELAAGGHVQLPNYSSNYDLRRLIESYQALPIDKQAAVDVARSAWQDQGYKGIRYINTAPLEAGAPGVKDPTSYIVFNPADLRSRFAGFRGDPESLRSPDLMRGAVAAPIGAGALGEMYDQGKYEAAP